MLVAFILTILKKANGALFCSRMVIYKCALILWNESARAWSSTMCNAKSKSKKEEHARIPTIQMK